MQITREEFLSFEKIRMSGATNMLDLDTVVSLSKTSKCRLTKEKVRAILNGYSELAEGLENEFGLDKELRE